MVTGDEDHLDVADRLAQLLEERPRAFERGTERKVAQLDHVAEQDEAVGAGDLLQQHSPHRRIAQHVLVGGDAEVEVGDDRRPHSREYDVWLGSQHGYDPQMHRFGDEQMAPANGIELCYQEMGDPDGEPLLLVMGLATQMIAWSEDFCALLAERGFRVVRFDNRDIGRSTKIRAAGVPNLLEMAVGRRGTAPYLLRDMAADTFGLMDHLGIDSAHLVGASMGGMIVQTKRDRASRGGSARWSRSCRPPAAAASASRATAPSASCSASPRASARR